MAKILIVSHQSAPIITELWPFTHVRKSSKFVSSQYSDMELVEFDNILQMLNHKQVLGWNHI